MGKSTIEIDYKCIHSTKAMHVYITNAKSLDAGNIIERGNIIKVADKDAREGSVRFSIMDLERDVEYYLEILAYDQKNSLIDRSYIVTTAKKEKEFFEVKAISGLWVFENPSAFNAVSGDPTYYDGVYIAPTPVVMNMCTHECFLYYSKKKTKLQSASFFYSGDKFQVKPNFGDVDVKKNEPIRVIALDIRNTLTSAGVMSDRSFYKEMDDILFTPWRFINAGKAEFYLIEYIPREVLSRAVVKNTTNDVESAVKEMEKIMVKGQFNTGKAPYVATGVSMMVFAAQCHKIYKAFCHQISDKEIDITVDVGDLYIYPMIATRKSTERI